MYKLGILIVHGIGTQPPDFADPMVQELQTRLRQLGHDPGAVCFKPVHWAPVLEPRESELFRTLSSYYRLDMVWLRKFIISVLGDAVAYNQNGPNEVYHDIHAKIHEALLELWRQDFEGEPRPVMFMASSLGCHVVSNYIWDRQHSYDPDLYGNTPFERLETLSGLITFGCNIPLFTLSHHPIVPIQFPPPTLDYRLSQVAKWVNFYDRDDALGYPLKPLSRAYDRAVAADVEVNVGLPLLSETITAHLGYWTDNDFTYPAAKLIGDILAVL